MTMTTTTAPNSTDQMRQKAHDIKDNIVDLAGMANDAAREKLADFKSGVGERYQAGIDKAGRARDGVVEYVKENPGKSLLACLAVGALAGFLISRRR
jgi:ElaB/YqjD/DUF883 family membrane-anchored ribosome-binding protein